MKVVIFCGGLGVRMGDATQSIPKPMVRIGNRPILWHIMRYYADWGHREFILCLGYRGDVIKEYFLEHNDALTNDFVLDRSDGTTRLELLSNDTAADWRATFVDTGLHTTIGERLKAVEDHIGDDEIFLATYGDGLTDAPLAAVVDEFAARGKIAMFLSVKPQFKAHLVTSDPDGTVVAVTDMSLSKIRINGGFFVFRRQIFDLIEPGDELVEETFARLIARGELAAYTYDGFFGPMDTIKDRQRLEALDESGSAPWRVLGPPHVPAPPIA
jgi:glucose-1-phosphate cytidylyltransferase